MRPQDEAQRNRRIVRPAAPSQRAAVFRRFRESEENPGLLGLVLLCLRRPTALAEIGAGGITGARVLVHLAAAYVSCDFIASAASAALRNGLSLGVVGRGGLGVLVGIASLLTETLALYFVASLVSRSVRFGDLLSGLALVSVITWALYLGLMVLAGAILLLGGAGLLDRGTRADAMVFVWVVWFLVMLFYLVHYLVGVFDMGCVGTFFLGLIALAVKIALDLCLLNLLLKVASV